MNSEIKMPTTRRGDWEGMPTTFADDVYYFLNWATANALNSKLPPVSASIEGGRLEKSVDIAVSLIEGTGVQPRSISSLAELVSVRIFTLLVHGGARSLSPKKLERLVSGLLAIAQHWVQPPSWHMNALHQVANGYCPRLSQQQLSSTKVALNSQSGEGGKDTRNLHNYV